MIWLQNRPWIEDEENPYYADNGDEHEEVDEVEDDDEEFEDEDFDEDDEFEDDDFEDDEDEDLEEESNEEGEEPGPATPLITVGSTPQSPTAA